MQQLPAREAVFHSLLVSQLTVNEHEDVGSLVFNKRQNIRLCTSKAVDIPEPHCGVTRCTFGGAALLAALDGEDGSGGSIIEVLHTSMESSGQMGTEAYLVGSKLVRGEKGLKQGHVLVKEFTLLPRSAGEGGRARSASLRRGHQATSSVRYVTSHE
jgi:hypothetical protein